MHRQDILMAGLFDRHPFTLFQQMLGPHFPIDVKQPPWILGMDIKEIQRGVVSHKDVVNVAGQEVMAQFEGGRGFVPDAF